MLHRTTIPDYFTEMIKYAKSKGIINSLCFAEIKTHKTKLLNAAYRPSVFPPSTELSGGIAQVQKTIQSSIENLINKSKKDIAYTMVDIATEADDSIINQIKAIPGMIKVTTFIFDNFND